MSQLLPKTHFSLNSFPLDVLQTLPVSTKIRQHFLARLMLLWNKVKEKKVKMAQSCPTLCDPMDYTVCRILQARILEWEAFPFSRGFSQPRDQTQGSPALQVASLPAEPQRKPDSTGVGTDFPNPGISCITGGFFTKWAIREAHCGANCNKLGFNQIKDQ